MNFLNTIWPYLAVGGSVTVLTQVIKRAAKLEKDGVIRTLFHGLAVASTFITFLLGNHGLSAVTLFLHGSAYSGIGNALYPVVKWADKWLGRIQQALKVVGSEEGTVQKVVDEVGAVSVPATPVVAATTVDF